MVIAECSYRKVQDLATATIGFSTASIDYRQLHGRLPDTRHLVRPALQSVREDLCQNRSAAAFMDGYTAISALLDERTCARHPIRWIGVAELQPRAGIVATVVKRAGADAI